MRANPVDADAVFARLKALAGSWGEINKRMDRRKQDPGYRA